MPGQVQEIPPARAQSMKAWWVCTALFAIVFVAIRLACANYPLFWDEWISIFFTRLPTGKLWSDWMVHESNPPLYYTLLKTWLNAFGSTPFSARMRSPLSRSSP
jgi:ABC-type Fe3+ transport system permease subunit